MEYTLLMDENNYYTIIVQCLKGFSEYERYKVDFKRIAYWHKIKGINKYSTCFYICGLGWHSVFYYGSIGIICVIALRQYFGILILNTNGNGKLLNKSKDSIANWKSECFSFSFSLHILFVYIRLYWIYYILMNS